MTIVPSFYEADGGAIHSIRLDDSLVAAGVGNPAPAGPATSPINAKISKSKREFGIRPRIARLARTQTTGASPGRKYRSLPVLTEDAWEGTAFQKGATVTLGTIAWRVIERWGEDY